MRVFFTSSYRWEPGARHEIDMAELVGMGVTTLRLRILDDPRFFEIDFLKPDDKKTARNAAPEAPDGAS